MNTIPNRMQRIIRYKVFEGMTWEQIAKRIGRRDTGEGVRMEYNRFMKESGFDFRLLSAGFVVYYLQKQVNYRN